MNNSRTGLISALATLFLITTACTHALATPPQPGQPTGLVWPTFTPGAQPTTPPVGAPGASLTYSSSLYGYQVSYPSDWTINVSTPTNATPGSNPEYVIFSSHDGTGLPQIDVYAMTGQPPMTGFENCEQNFVFHDLPTCRLSQPAGQNAAAEVWIFQKDSAYFFIQVQYEGPQLADQRIIDFLSSFHFQ